MLAISLTLLFSQFSPFPDAYEGKDDFFKYLEGKDVGGEVLISHPYINLYTNTKVTPMYYMVFNSELARYWIGHIENNDINYIFIDTCEGGMLCPPSDITCEQERNNLIKTAKVNFDTKLHEKRGNCNYYVFKRKR